MTRKPRQTFSEEFKREAVRLLEQGDKTAAQLARELGIRRNQLYKWKAEVDEFSEMAFKRKSGRPKKDSVDGLAALQAENKRLKEEVESLKKAAIFFARESQ